MDSNLPRYSLTIASSLPFIVYLTIVLKLNSTSQCSTQCSMINQVNGQSHTFQQGKHPYQNTNGSFKRVHVTAKRELV